MQVYHASELTGRTESRGRGTRSTQLYPGGSAAQGLLVLDLLEVEQGAEMSQVGLPEERVMFVLAGTGELSGGSAQGPTVTVRRDTVVHLGQHESCTLRNTGSEPLRVLLSSSTLVRSSRASGVQTAPTQAAPPPPEPATSAQVSQEA